MAELDLDDPKPDEPAPKPKPGRPPKTVTITELERTIKDGLGEVAEWLRDEELAENLREGAPRMAKVLAARAAKHRNLERLLKVGFAPDGPLAILRAFGPTARRVGDRVGAWRESRIVDADVVECTCGAGEHAPPPAHHVSCPLASIATA